MVMGSFWYGESEKTIHERRKAPEPDKKVIKVWGQKLWSRFLIGSGILHRSWIFFSDSPYQKLPPTPFHIAYTRCYVPFPYFYVSHANSTWWRIFTPYYRQVNISAFSIDKDVIEWNPQAPFKILSVFADGGFHSSEKTPTVNPPPISFNDWNWSNFSEIEPYGNFSAKELGDIVNEVEFSMEFLLTGSWELHILRIFDEFTTDYKENFIDSKSFLWLKSRVRRMGEFTDGLSQTSTGLMNWVICTPVWMWYD